MKMTTPLARSRAQWLIRLSQVALVALLAAGLVAGCSDDEEGGNNNKADVGTDAGNDGGDAGDATDAGEQAVMIDGLSAPVKVQYDDLGVLHIDCQTNNDCYAAEGYYHAANRFVEMDLIRRQMRGQLSTLIGEAGYSSDKFYRHLMTTADGTPLEDAYYEQVSDDTKAMLQAYASGVNAWLADMRAGRNGAALTGEYDLPFVNTEIRDWEPEDTIALYMQLANQLSQTATDDVARGQMAAQLDPAVFADLFTPKPATDSYIIQASGVDPATMLGADLAHPYSIEAIRRAQQRLRPAGGALAAARERLTNHPSMVFGQRTGDDGSNNWVVGPSRTKDGNALLANDPHLSLSNPAIWYFVELDSKTNGQGDLHVAGASVPAVPGIVIGHNEDVAWGVTTAYLDLADAYVETLNDDGTAVIQDGQEVALVTKDFTFNTSDGTSHTDTFEWVPGHGPVLSKDMDNKRAVSMRWVFQEPGNDIDFLPALFGAGNIQEAMDAMAPMRSINQNWVFIDGDGKIAWYPRADIPKRPWADTATPSWLPVPGDGNHEWDGFVAMADAPKMVDPPEGFIATANNDMDGSFADGDNTNDGHTPWQVPPAIGYRHKRIVDLIQDGGNEHTQQTMTDIQADTYIGQAERIVPHILQVANDNSDQLSADAQAVVDALDNWGYTCPDGLDGTDPQTATKVSDAAETKESIGCSAFHVMLPSLTDRIFGDEVPDYDAFGNYGRLQAATAFIFDAPGELNNGTDYFDDVSTDATVETETDIVLAELEATATRLADTFGSSDPDDWRWGRVHTVTFTSALNQLTQDFNIGPFVNDGGYTSVDVASPNAANYSHGHGPSLRVVFEATADGIVGTFQLPGNQDHHMGAETDGTLIDRWLSNTPSTLLFGRDEVDQAAIETIEVQPGPAQ